ncbi:hypothetical protein A2U01_0053453, partial [Trifolium medium]|nr:hypothetical protein [Trifolium medium]
AAEARAQLATTKDLLKLKEEAVNAVKLNRDVAYLDGFDLAIAQAKVIYLDVDHSLLEQADAFKVIKYGKLVDQEVSGSGGASEVPGGGEVKIADGSPDIIVDVVNSVV